jgi:hypothetical protein
MMNPGARRLVWLGGIACVGAIAFTVSGWRADGALAPQQAPTPVPAPAPPVVSVAPAEPAPPPVAVAAASPPGVASAAIPASAVLRVPPMDVSRLQRDIQLAISSDQPGKAGEAARHIQRCLALERDPERQRKSREAFARNLSEPVASAMRTIQHQMDAACQAVDAASRAQLVPLLRRSLAEGDKGAAAGLVQALGKSFNLADEPDVVPALRRDAWDCDRSSQLVLSSLVRRDPQLLTPNEIGALRDQQLRWSGRGLETAIRAEGDPRRKAILEQLLASYQPPPEADPAEVARVTADIQSRCTDGVVRSAMPG